MDFFIRILGLDKQASQKVLEYGVIIAVGSALCLHLGATLIAVGNSLLAVSSALSVLGSFGSGGNGMMTSFALINTKLSTIGPIMHAASPDIHWCLAAIAAGFAYLKVRVNHASNAIAINQLKDTLAGAAQPPAPASPTEVKP